MAEMLKVLIRESGESLASIGKKAGIPQPVLWRFVQGERDLALRTAQKLVDLFGLELRRTR